MKTSHKRCRAQGSSIAELGPVIWIFFIFIVFPIIDLASFCWGMGTIIYTTNTAAKQAAIAETFSTAISSVKKTSDLLAGLHSFAKVEPHNAGTTGMKLVVLKTSTVDQVSASDGQVRYSPPPKIGAIPNDSDTLSNNIYQYEISSSYDIWPIFNFKGLPYLGSVPMLGQPSVINFTAVAAVEHPEGLNE